MPAAADPVGHRLGPYRIEARLGEGGMGIVYLASDGDGRPVALKVLRDELAADDAFRRRLAREARAAAEVDHPNLARCSRWGRPRSPVPGRPLRRGSRPWPSGWPPTGRCRSPSWCGWPPRSGRPGRAPPARDRAPRRQAGQHPAGRRRHGRAGRLRPGQAPRLDGPDRAGTGSRDPRLPGPELIRGSRPALSDLYALGCVLFECLAGAPPFAGRSVLRVGMAHLEEEPGDPGASRDDVPPALSGRSARRWPRTRAGGRRARSRWPVCFAWRPPRGPR